MVCDFMVKRVTNVAKPTRSGLGLTGRSLNQIKLHRGSLPLDNGPTGLFKKTVGEKKQSVMVSGGAEIRRSDDELTREAKTVETDSDGANTHQRRSTQRQTQTPLAILK